MAQFSVKIMRLTGSVLSENQHMISMALATPFLPFLPLAAKQILLNNFLSDLPSIAISTDRVDAERVATPQRWRMDEVRRFMIVFGLVSYLIVDQKDSKKALTEIHHIFFNVNS